MPKKPSLDVEGKALHHVKSLTAHFVSQTQRLRNNWLRFYQLYRFFSHEDRKDSGANLVIPKAFELVEDISARLTAHNPQFLAVPKRDLPGQMEDVIRQYLEYVWDEGGLKMKLRNVAKNSLIYGTGFVKVRWEVEQKQTITTEEGVDEDGVESEAEILETEVTREFPTFDSVDIFDLFVDPTEENLQKGMGIIHKIDYMSLDELDPDVYFNLDEIKQKALDLNAKDTQEHEKEVKYQQRGISTDELPNDFRFNIKEYWGKFSPDGEADSEREFIITTAMDDSILIRFEENKLSFRPFVAFHDSRVPGELYSIGEIEPVESLIRELETTRNQRLNVVNANLYHRWRMSPDTNLNPTDTLRALTQTHGLIIANEGDIEPLETRNPIPAAYTEESSILRDIQSTTGTINVGQEAGRGSFTNTATGERIRASLQNARYSYKIENLEIALAEVGEMMIGLAAANIEGTEPIRVVKEDGSFEFLELDESVLKLAADSFHVRIEAGSTGAATPAERRNDALAFGNISAQYASIGVPVNMVEVYREIAKQFNKTNVDELLLVGPQQATVGESQVGSVQTPTLELEGQELIPESLTI